MGELDVVGVEDGHGFDWGAAGEPPPLTHSPAWLDSHTK